jgi:hypothetical protein
MIAAVAAEIQFLEKRMYFDHRNNPIARTPIRIFRKFELLASHIFNAGTGIYGTDTNCFSIHDS